MYKQTTVITIRRITSSSKQYLTVIASLCHEDVIQYVVTAMLKAYITHVKCTVACFIVLLFYQTFVTKLQYDSFQKICFSCIHLLFICHFGAVYILVWRKVYSCYILLIATWYLFRFYIWSKEKTTTTKEAPLFVI